MADYEERRGVRHRVYDEDRDDGRQGRVSGQGYGNYGRDDDRRAYGAGGTVGGGYRRDREGDYARGYSGGDYGRGAGGSFRPYGERGGERGFVGSRDYGSRDYGERGRSHGQGYGNLDNPDYGNREFGGPTYGQPTTGDRYADRGARSGGMGYAGRYGDDGARRETRGYGEGRSYGGRDDDRGFFERAGDEIASWFGSDEAERRREMDARRGDSGAQHHRGRGPRGYTRSDDRIREDINDRLTDDYYVDATDVDVTVSGTEVTLSGTVDNREAKRRAEDIAEAVSGVSHVQNNLRVRQQQHGAGSRLSGTAGMTGGSGGGGTTGGMGMTGGTGSGGSSSSTTGGTAGMGAGGTTASTTLGGNVNSPGVGRTTGSGRTDSF
jgi:osmotically-inducible protein OsmY